VALNGIFPSLTGGSNDSRFYLGQLMLFAGSVVPKGWAQANGQLLNISSNQALFSILGSRYGGNGQTTFGLPDLRGRIAVGSGALINPTLPPQSDAQVPLIPSITLGGTAQGQAAVLGVNFVIARKGVLLDHNGTAPTLAAGSIGEIIIFAGNFAPGDWATANGSILNNAGIDPLFATIGVTYGGDVTRNFALPNLSARAPMGSH
jgi:microcystin-dependent protein